MNPHHLDVVCRCFSTSKLPYLRHIEDKCELTIATVNSAQGKEYDFVILDVVNPCGAAYPLGFLSHLKRMNVSLSRAKMGLLIVGDKNMGNVQRTSALGGYKSMEGACGCAPD